LPLLHPLLFSHYTSITTIYTLSLHDALPIYLCRTIAYLHTCKRYPACHPERSEAELKDPAALWIWQRVSSTSLGITKRCTAHTTVIHFARPTSAGRSSLPAG